MGSEIMAGASLLVRLGLAVWEAIESGDRSKTVGEIFDGVPRDEEAMKAIREDARAHYEKRGT